MFRNPAMLMMFVSLAAFPAMAQTNDQSNANEPNAPEAATDATTHMDKALGNEDPVPNKTLSNAEVKHLQEQSRTGNNVGTLPPDKTIDEDTAH